MASNDRDEELDLNALVARCAGPDKKEQGEYLVKVIMKLLIQHFGRGKKLPDENVLRVLGICEEDTRVAMKVLDGIYAWVSKSLLGDSCCDLPNIHSEAIEYMRSDLERRQAIQREAGI